jgi:hypothetical protein
VVVRRTSDDQQAVALYRFSPDPAEAPVPPGPWHAALDTAAVEWSGPGTGVPATVPIEQRHVTLAPWSAVLLVSS